MNVNRLAAQKNSVKIVMEVERIKALLREVKFFYRRKKMPRIEDHGVADVDLTQGTGVSVKIVWKLKTRMNQPMLLRLLKVKCNIDRLAITVRSAKHNILDKLVTKLFAGQIKKQIANAIVNNLITSLQPLSVKLNELFKRRPMGSLVERANTGMKSTFTSGEHTQGGLLHRAKETITSGVQHAKSNTSTTPFDSSSGMMSTTSSVPGITSVDTLNSGFDNMTFMEKDRNGQRGWNFEWYSPATEDSIESVNTNAMMNTNTNPLVTDKYEQTQVGNTPLTSI